MGQPTGAQILLTVFFVFVLVGIITYRQELWAKIKNISKTIITRQTQ